MRRRENSGSTRSGRVIRKDATRPMVRKKRSPLVFQSAVDIATEVGRFIGKFFTSCIRHTLTDGLHVAAEQAADLLPGEPDRVTVSAHIQSHRAIRGLINLDLAHSVSVHSFDRIPVLVLVLPCAARPTKSNPCRFCKISIRRPTGAASGDKLTPCRKPRRVRRRLHRIYRETVGVAGVSLGRSRSRGNSLLLAQPPTGIHRPLRASRGAAAEARRRRGVNQFRKMVTYAALHHQPDLGPRSRT